LDAITLARLGGRFRDVSGSKTPGSDSKRGEASVLRGAAARVEVSETVVSPLVPTRSRVPCVYDGD